MAAGTRTLSNTSSAVGEARILSECGVRLSTPDVLHRAVTLSRPTTHTLQRAPLSRLKLHTLVVEHQLRCRLGPHPAHRVRVRCQASCTPECGVRLSTTYTLHPTPHTLHPTPYTLQPTPCTLHPTPYTPHPTPYTPHPTPHTPHPTPYTLHPSPHTRHPTPYTLPDTLHPKPYTLNPKS